MDGPRYKNVTCLLDVCYVSLVYIYEKAFVRCAVLHIPATLYCYCFVFSILCNFFVVEKCYGFMVLVNICEASPVKHFIYVIITFIVADVHTLCVCICACTTVENYVTT